MDSSFGHVSFVKSFSMNFDVEFVGNDVLGFFTAKSPSLRQTATHAFVSIDKRFCFYVTVRYHCGGSMKFNARILHLAYMVYL
jgi:hypothetical protein